VVASPRNHMRKGSPGLGTPLNFGQIRGGRFFMGESKDLGRCTDDGDEAEQDGSRR
jgi:hypothetical protein